MIRSELFGEIRSVVQCTPSAVLWQSLCELVERWPREQFTTELLPYLCANLVAWPSSLKVAPQRWIDTILAGKVSPYCHLVESLDVSDQRLSTSELKCLVTAQELNGLRILNLSKNVLGSEGATLLSAQANWSQLEALELNDCELGDDGITTLSELSLIHI